MPSPVIVASTSDKADGDVFCACPLAAGDEVKVEIDDGAILVSCPRCGRQISLEAVSVHAAPRAATVSAESLGDEQWLEVRI